MECNRCSGLTTEKQITSKKNGKIYTVFECASGCMDGKWKYSFFPPRDNAPKQAPIPVNSGETKEMFLKVMKKLDDILAMLDAETDFNGEEKDAGENRIF